MSLWRAVAAHSGPGKLAMGRQVLNVSISTVCNRGQAPADPGLQMSCLLSAIKGAQQLLEALQLRPLKHTACCWLIAKAPTPCRMLLRRPEGESGLLPAIVVGWGRGPAEHCHADIELRLPAALQLVTTHPQT